LSWAIYLCGVNARLAQNNGMTPWKQSMFMGEVDRIQRIDPEGGAKDEGRGFQASIRSIRA